MRTAKTARIVLLSSVATVALMSQAMALEAQAFVDRVAAVYKTVGYDLEFGTATLDGDTVTVDGVTVGVEGMEGEDSTFTSDATLTFEGVVDNGDGSYNAASLTIPDVDSSFSEDGVEGHVSLADIRADGLWFPAGDTVPAVDILQLVESISTGSLSVTRNGDEVIAYDSLTAASTFNPAQGDPNLVDLSSSLNIAGIAVDLSTVSEEDAEAGATIEALGLTNIAGDITQEFSWSMADGHMNLSEFLFDFADIGALNIKADITGMTPAVLDQIYAMQAQMAANGDGEMTDEQAQAQMMSSMALMQGVSIISASVRYDDAGLAIPLLDYFAEENGTDRAAFVEGLKATLPQMLAGSGVPALNDVIVPPVSAFLDDPQSLEVKVAPPSPTSLLVLMAAAANPAGLVQALGLAIEANTAE